jgi:peptidoglycan/LPS O-acetylase OafA/YrhL
VALILLPVLRGAHGLGDAPTPAPGVLLSHALLLEWQLDPGETGFRMVGSLWMVCVIVPFYVLFPVIAGRYLRHPYVGLVLGCSVATLWWAAVGRHELPQVLSFADDFAVGMTAAWMYVGIRRTRADQARRLATPIACAGAGLALAVGYLIGLPVSRGEALRYAENPALSIFLALALGAFVLAVPFSAHWLRSVFANRPARWTGKVSYGVFLFHGPITVVAMKLGFAHDGQTASLLALVLFVVPLSFLAGWLTFRYVELPVRARLGIPAERSEQRDAVPATASSAP